MQWPTKAQYLEAGTPKQVLVPERSRLGLGLERSKQEQAQEQSTQELEPAQISPPERVADKLELEPRGC